MKKLNTQSELDQRSSFFGVTNLQVFSKASSYLSDGAPHSGWKEGIHPDRNLEGQRFGEKKLDLKRRDGISIYYIMYICTYTTLYTLHVHVHILRQYKYMHILYK